MFTEKQMEIVKGMDLLTYMEEAEPNNLVRLSSNEYCTQEHDSLKISNGKWMWWSRGIGGRTALDYLIKVKHMSFVDAVERILRVEKGLELVFNRPDRLTRNEEKKLILPEKSPTNNIVKQYLKGRHIDEGIIDECLERGLIYESLPLHGVIFLGRDDSGKNRYAAYRSAGQDRIMGECSGSNKRFSFRLAEGKRSQIHVFESAIDLLSCATLIKEKGRDYHQYDLLSLGGVYGSANQKKPMKVPIALWDYLEKHPKVGVIELHLDNDETGRQASQAIQNQLKAAYKVIDLPPPYGKDFNDFLCLQRKTKIKTGDEKYYGK